MTVLRSTIWHLVIDALEKGQNVAGKLPYGGNRKVLGTFKYGQKSKNLEEE